MDIDERRRMMLMMGEPLVSVIVPTYNAEKYIGRCVGSIVESTWQNIEIILVDDKSEDTTLAQVKSIKDERLKIIEQPQRGGVSRARNTGLDNAGGEYVLFVDSDDWIEPGAIEVLMQKATALEADIVLCDYCMVYDSGTEYFEKTKEDTLVFRGNRIRQFVRMFVLKNQPEYEPYFRMGQPVGTLYRRKLIEENSLRFIEGLQYKEDVIFNLYASQLSRCIVRINDVLYNYNKCNVGSLTTSGFKKDIIRYVQWDIEERIRFSETYYPEDPLFQKGLNAYIVHSFLRVVAPACAESRNVHEMYRLYHEGPLFKTAFSGDLSGLGRQDRLLAVLMKTVGVKMYYCLLRGWRGIRRLRRGR